MLNTKFDLYKTEWLDLVFTGRNKSYGAYELRQHYAGTMLKAMAIAFTGVVGAAMLCSAVIAPKAGTEIIDTIVDVDMPVLPINPPAEKVEPKVVEPKQPSKPAPAVKTIANLPPVVKSDDQAPDEPVKIVDLKDAASGSVTSEGKDPGDGGNAPAESGSGNGTASVPAVSNEPVMAAVLEVQPEPMGGFGAFSKFLSRNLRFPSAAAEAEKQGRVVVSFVIERDGTLTDITVVAGPGYGMNEEAVRVLKMAKAWKPGIQNGKPVRVRYNVPINFQLPE